MSSPDGILGKRKPQEQASQTPDLLEVEDDEARVVRLGKLLEQKASEDTQRSPTGKRIRGGPVNGEEELPLRLGRLNEPLPTPESTSNLLARLDAFLPALKASTEALLDQAARDPASVDIEHLTPVEEGMEPEHIEMNLGLGVFTLKKTEPGNNDASAEEDSDRETSDDEDTSHAQTDTTSGSGDEATVSSEEDDTESTDGSSEDSSSEADRGDDPFHDRRNSAGGVAAPQHQRPPGI